MKTFNHYLDEEICKDVRENTSIHTSRATVNMLNDHENKLEGIQKATLLQDVANMSMAEIFTLAIGDLENKVEALEKQNKENFDFWLIQIWEQHKKIESQEATITFLIKENTEHGKRLDFII